MWFLFPFSIVREEGRRHRHCSIIRKGLAVQDDKKQQSKGHRLKRRKQLHPHSQRIWLSMYKMPENLFFKTSRVSLVRPTHKNQSYFMYKRWTNRNWIFFKNTIYNSSSKREILRYKSNKAYAGSECWKLQTIDERNQRSNYITRKTFLAHGLEDSAQ